MSLISQKEGASLKKDSLEKEALIRTIVVKFKGLRKGGNFIYPMMHRFILYYQASERT